MITKLIQQIEDWQNKTAVQIAEELNTPSIPKVDNDLYTYAGVVDKLKQEAGFAFRATMRVIAAPSNPASLPDALFEPLNFAHDRLTVGGLDFSRQDVQDLLDALSIVPQLSPFVTLLKQIGRYQVSLAQNAGLETVSVEQVDDGLLAIRKKTLEDAAINRLQSYREALSVWNGEGEEPVL